jgi:transcription initiation factor IIE alpha subunit
LTWKTTSWKIEMKKLNEKVHKQINNFDEELNESESESENES